jgi:hypothetical protein
MLYHVEITLLYMYQAHRHMQLEGYPLEYYLWFYMALYATVRRRGGYPWPL